MKNIYKILFILSLFNIAIFAGEKKVLVEIFTNAHCTVCPPAHSALQQYLQSTNGDKIEFIYYHMAFPYNSDELYKHNTSDSENKNSFYGSFSSTPQPFFNGEHRQRNYSGWSSELDGLVAEESSFDLTVTGEREENNFTITASVTKTTDVTENDLTINYVVVEHIDNYTGQNQISDHKNVMRKIVNPKGDALTINLNESKYLSTTIDFNNLWNPDELKVIVFIQSASSKKIFQSGSISFSELSITGINDAKNFPNEFSLKQNYPNPFNPATTIKYSIPNVASNFSEGVLLKVYDTVGKQVATLVNKQQAAGNYKVEFDASKLSSGVYYYSLTIGSFSETKKLVLMK